MAWKKDELPLDADAKNADFASLIGSQAHIAKQLDNWWRYKLPGSSDDNDGCVEDAEAQASREISIEGKLIRKHRHSMPFLLRSLSNCPFQPTQKTVAPSRRIQSCITNSSETVDVIGQCFGTASPNKFRQEEKHENDFAVSNIIGSIRQNITGWFSSLKHEEHDPQDVTFQLKSRTEIRAMVLNTVDSSLLHDEEFILNRIEALWQEMNQDDFKMDESLKRMHDADTNNDQRKQPNKDIDLHRKRHKVHHSKSKTSPIEASSNMKQRSHHPVYFHYMHIDENNHPCTFVEKRLDRKCPFCNFYGKSNEDLLHHCGIFHGIFPDYYPYMDFRYGFSFQAVFDEEKHLHIVVKKLNYNFNKVTDDFTFVQMKHPKKSKCTISFLRRSPKNTAALDPLVRKRRVTALESNDAPESVISCYLPTDEVPIRQYFHSRTNLPLEDWNNIDSDDEPDEEWLHKLNSDLIEEFEDVSDKEKEFMKMWNRFIKCHIVIADREIPKKCHDFIYSHVKQLEDRGMRSNLLLHLMNLWDCGVVSSARVLACMQQYDLGVAALKD